MHDELSRRLPAPLLPLATLAMNLRWSWRPECRALFQEIDAVLLEETHQNPVRVLLQADGERLAFLAEDPAFLSRVRSEKLNLASYMASRTRPGPGATAYFSAEFAITKCLRVFSGGLGVLAGDHLKSASDVGEPLIGVGLLYRDGYFTQEISVEGRQVEHYWPLKKQLLPLTLERTKQGEPRNVRVDIAGRTVTLQVWRADVGNVPLYLLDSDVEANEDRDRHITDRLYGGDNLHRLEQEIVLGIGGMKAVRALGFEPDVIHMNEGHAAFASIERASTRIASGMPAQDAFARVAASSVFTTHTPVAAGHDYFPSDTLMHSLGGYIQASGVSWERFADLGRAHDSDERFCMTALALRMADRRNGVSELHGKVSRVMWQHFFPGAVQHDAVPIGHVTNGVHIPTWMGSETRSLAESTDVSAALARSGDVAAAVLFAADRVSNDVLWDARNRARRRLVEYANGVYAQQMGRRTGREFTERPLDPARLTIVFARRFATYKRATLLLRDMDRIQHIVNSDEGVQFVFAGKAHPKDEDGKHFLQQVYQASESLGRRLIIIENYDVELASHLVQGADVWLNTPRRPYEASGTSGMKAAANGVLNLSVPDGWWAEAVAMHGQNASARAPIGWTVGGSEIGSEWDQDEADAQELYAAIESSVKPAFYARNVRGVPDLWCDMIRETLIHNVRFFNTDRMVLEYSKNFYGPARLAERSETVRGAIAR